MGSPTASARLRDALVAASPGAPLRELVRDGLAGLPLPGAGQTLERWRALAVVAGHDLSLVKRFEGHTDALAIMDEAGGALSDADRLRTWGMWAAESPGARVVFAPTGDGACELSGVKAWCSGARQADSGLLTVWDETGAGPFLARVDMAQPGVWFDDSNWQAVGMRDSDSVDVRFDRVPARLVGGERFYLERQGFWHGGIGIAACWHGGACTLANALRRQATVAAERAGWHRLLGLGAIDRVLSANAALLREAAQWVDAHPAEDAQAWALRTRAAADAACEQVLHHAARALGATPLCRDAGFARMAADLPVFVRQCHGDRDLAALGERIVGGGQTSWTL